MSDHDIDYPPPEAVADVADVADLGRRTRTWVAVTRDIAAGYDPDPLGGFRLVGVVVYSPDTERLRGIRLRELEALDPAGRPDAMVQDDPPGPAQLLEAARKRLPSWADLGGLTYADFVDVTYADLGSWETVEHLEEARRLASREQLSRRQGDAPDDFYRRVAAAHNALARVSDKPTARLAERAGVPVGTAASWVSRARARGLLNDDGRGK